ncbi:30S ribosomal protein S9 [Patescibacteria group bacterium]|nr:30S ribosomal protein S9 [Patescibacteria group bacterium]
MADQYFKAIGRRKTAIAQVRLYPNGSGKVTVNGKDLREYLNGETVVGLALAPLKEVGMSETADVTVRAVGGGMRGQAEAIQLGIARALVKFNDELKKTLRSQDFVTRDPRKKERKKFGLRGARRARQWRKR